MSKLHSKCSQLSPLAQNAKKICQKAKRQYSTFVQPYLPEQDYQRWIFTMRLFKNLVHTTKSKHLNIGRKRRRKIYGSNRTGRWSDMCFLHRPSLLCFSCLCCGMWVSSLLLCLLLLSSYLLSLCWLRCCYLCCHCLCCHGLGCHYLHCICYLCLCCSCLHQICKNELQKRVFSVLQLFSADNAFRCTSISWRIITNFLELPCTDVILFQLFKISEHCQNCQTCQNVKKL